MDWQSATALGAVGGALVEAINLSARVNAWQEARHRARQDAAEVPPFGSFIDAPADGLAMLTRFVLGAVTAYVWHAQLAGAEAAVAVGASAPALLRQLRGVPLPVRELPDPPDGDVTPCTSPPLPGPSGSVRPVAGVPGQGGGHRVETE